MKINKGPGLFAAAAGISILVTAGFGWLEVLLGWCIAGLIWWGIDAGNRKRHNIIVYLWGTALLVGILLAAEKAFPQDSTFPFVSLGLLLLLYRCLIGDRDAGIMAANILGMALLAMLGSLLIFGAKNVTWTENIPGGFRWSRVWITMSIASVWWLEPDKQENTRWFILGGSMGVAISLVTRGILGKALTAYTDAPAYHAVQTVRIFGVLERLESLVAIAGLIGGFSMMVYVGNQIRTAAEGITAGRGTKVWLIASLGGVFILECLYRMAGSEIKRGIGTIFWGITPVLALWVVNKRKVRKNEKSA